MFGFWLGLFLVLVFLEMATINLVSIWFAIGALASTLATLVTDVIWIQTLIFVIVSVISFLLTKPLVKKFRGKKIEPTNLDRVIGKIGIVTEKITKLEPGEVKIDGKRWSATSAKMIPEGTKIEALAIEGVKLQVREIEEEE